MCMCMGVYIIYVSVCVILVCIDIYIYMCVCVCMYVCVWHNMTYVYSSIPLDLYLTVFHTVPFWGYLTIGQAMGFSEFEGKERAERELFEAHQCCSLLIAVPTFPFCLTADCTTRTTQDHYRQQCQGSISILSSGYLVAGNANLHRTDEWNVGCFRLQVQYWTWRTPTTLLYL